MTIAGGILDDLERQWEQAEVRPPVAGDIVIEKSRGIGYAVFDWLESMDPRPDDRIRVAERAEPKPRAVMASADFDPQHRRQVFVLTVYGNWESPLHVLEHDELVDPVEMVEMPTREELLEALRRAYDAWAEDLDCEGGANGHRAEAVLELLGR